MVQQDQLQSLESKFSATLLNIKLGKIDPASEELVEVILSSRHDCLVLIENKLADFLCNDNKKDALRFLSELQLLTQQEKLKLSTFLQYKQTWDEFSRQLVEPEPLSSSELSTYLNLLGIKIERPLTELEERGLALKGLLKEKNYKQICLLRPWPLSEDQGTKLANLCDPLSMIHTQFE